VAARRGQVTRQAARDRPEPASLGTLCAGTARGGRRTRREALCSISARYNALYGIIIQSVGPTHREPLAGHEGERRHGRDQAEEVQGASHCSIRDFMVALGSW
jgi:hypothetical protein